uniref:MGA conserved domain-containing protein n=1 Tax=Heliothis virescens TaxID=7102 RepID=A0A2A4JSA7_HELVI
MLINLNPEHHKCPRQFIKWNGKYIQVNGSLGGRKQLLCNYDLAFKSPPSQSGKKKIFNNYAGIRKKGLLRNSLVLHFKPGPLCKKQFLDDSPQKYHIGNTELTDLPKPGLDIKPSYGTALESTITQYLNNMRPEDGTITEKWAEFAVSVLGTVKKSNAVQINRDCITFDLAYKYNQNKLLMRRGADFLFNTSELTEVRAVDTQAERTETEIQDIMNKIIDAVEINLTQDTLFTQEQEEPLSLTDSKSMDVVNAKDKLKRKYGELDRLAVRVITLPEIEEPDLSKSCDNMHCSLGCVCASLQCTYNLKQHCGRIECMFDCKCDYNRYRDDPSYAECSDLLPGLINIKNGVDLHLAKEEQKFHQTVIVSGKKRILLKGEKRNSKPSKKYADFYSNMASKQEKQKKLYASVVAIKFDTNNIEPWCMVHNLYKCFCKGKFTETCANISEDKESLSQETTNDAEGLENLTKETNDDTTVEECPSKRLKEQQKSKSFESTKSNKVNKSKSFDKLKNDNNIEENFNNNSESDIKNHRSTDTMDVQRSKNSRYTLRQLKTTNFIGDTNKSNEKTFYSDDSDSIDFAEDNCSRTSAYVGRKYTNGYYKNTNRKILEMEQHDKRLQERLNLINSKVDGEKTVSNTTVKTTHDAVNQSEMLCETNENSVDALPPSNRKRLLSETKLVSWLESNYKIYKQRNDRGFFKNALEPPQLGKVALHSWEFILTRYRERKNLFLVSRQKPFRIFMAVNTNNPFFANCININDIRFADLHKYPQTVKNLLINATDLKDNFCILRGLSSCWELIGSVTKVSESDGSGAEHEGSPKMNMNPDESDMDMSADFNQNNLMSDESLTEHTEQNEIQTSSKHKKDSESKTCLDYVGSSKWFVMTIENDFSEIRFFRKGFFVKYESIINAISVARLSGKTVRLSSKKCIEQPEAPQFGIYAIPNNNEYSVFVGPYEMEDTLGIETIKTISDVRSRRVKRTRGFWITTNKVDNLKVVENPLSFVPSTNTQNTSEIPLEGHFSSNVEINKNQQEKTKSLESVDSNKKEESTDCSPSKTEIKVVKPIKIRKTNGFYHLASDGVLKKITYQKIAPKPVITRLNIGDCVIENTRSLLKLSKKTGIDNNVNEVTSVIATSQELVTEAVSQIKISSVYSTQNEHSASKPIKQEGGMFILKPEEINRKVIQNQLAAEVSSASRDGYENNNEAESIFLDSDNENVMPESTDWNDDNVNIYVLSDEENERTSETIDNTQLWTDVCIECTNIPSLGWIAGIRNSENLVSFKLPGSEYSEFYTEEKAFAEINSELSKKINSSMNITLQWKVNESSDKIEGHEINPDHLYPDYVNLLKGSEEPKEDNIHH